jgi:hypothetical protein
MEAGKIVVLVAESSDMAAVIFFFLVISDAVANPTHFYRVGQALLRLVFFFSIFFLFCT